MLVPYSLRELPQAATQHRLHNEFSVLCFTLKLRSTFEESISLVSAKTRALKNSTYPYGVLALTQVIAWLPGIVG
jgi:hypothetical protein